MANIKSQIKRNRSSEKARQRNKAVKSALKTAIRKVDACTDPTAGHDAARYAARLLDKAASKGVIHKNQAANRKSALARKAAALAG